MSKSCAEHQRELVVNCNTCEQEFHGDEKVRASIARVRARVTSRRDGVWWNQIREPMIKDDDLLVLTIAAEKWLKSQECGTCRTCWNTRPAD